MPKSKDIFLRAVNVLHRNVFRLSKGRIANRGLGMPVVELTTTGRKSGRTRTVMLTSPVQEGERLVIVASKGGDDRHPDWFLNLRDQPRVDVRMDGATQSMNARIATSAEKAELWPKVVAAYKGYAQYQKRTERDIPLVILEPVA
ncbi:MAG: nitroreductase family deazaflavin-dependent oxidoreductase [Acidimicrobiia bacterium]|nr:nitroreductase family deazaflavin-dependent oxidoreductase [Acidimicrobiia bacterium]